MDNIINKLLVNSDIKSNDYVQGLVDMYRSLGYSKGNEMGDNSIKLSINDEGHLYEIDQLINNDERISKFSKEYKLNLIRRIKETGVSQLVNVNSIDLSDRDIILLKRCYKIIQDKKYSAFFNLNDKANLLELLDRIINKK